MTIPFRTLLCLLGGILFTTGTTAKPLQFNLEEHLLGTVTEKNWPGKYLLIGVGYTSCPDICPTTVIDQVTAVNTLAEDKDKVIPIFITVDPNRDSAQNIDLYVKYFSKDMVGLSGSDEQIRNAANSLRATYGYSLQGKPVYPPLPQRYEVFHSAYLYFYGPDRKLIDVYGYGKGGAMVGRSIKRHLNE